MKTAYYLLGQLSDDDIDWMLGVGTRVRYPAETVLIREGEPAAALFLMLSGSVAITEGNRLWATRGAGEFLGEVSFVDGRPPTATVTTCVSSLVFAIERGRLLAKLERDSGFAARFYRAITAFLADRLRDTMRGGQGGPPAEPESAAWMLTNEPLAQARYHRLVNRLGTGPGTVVLTGNDLTPHDVTAVAEGRIPVEVSDIALARLAQSRAVVERLAGEGHPIYGLTTGVGSLKGERITADAMHRFQQNVLMSHATGIGPEYPSAIVRAIMVARLNGMARGGSGVQPAVFRLLLEMLNRGVHPIVPSRGSIGMSDLPQLAHLALPLIGLGEVEYQGVRLPGREGLRRARLKPVRLGPKDGLALCSANSASVGHGALVLAKSLELLTCADIVAAMSLEGFQGNTGPLDARIHAVRPYSGQLGCAERFRELLAGSGLWSEETRRSIQDPLSFRCVTQVHGACHDALAFVRQTMEIELNGTGDNPVVLPEFGVIISNGNFHTAGLSMAFDMLGIVLGQLTSLSTSRVMALMDRRLTDLPPALTPNPGLNSGFNPLQKSLTALNAENRFLASPASLDFTPVADDIEDHATNSILCVSKADRIVENSRRVLAIELLTAAQAISLRSALHLGAGVRGAYEAVRAAVPFLTEDRVMAPLVEDAYQLIASGRLLEAVGGPADDRFHHSSS